MTPPDDMPPDDEFDGAFPPPGWEEMDVYERDEAVRAHRDRLVRRRAALVAQGPESAYLVAELDAELSRLNEAIARVEPSRREFEKADDALLAASADVADLRVEAYTRFNALVQWVARQRPDDPSAAETKRRFDKIAKEIPAELLQLERTTTELEAELRRQGFFEPPPAGPGEPGAAAP